jgi:hypothetical protein
MKFLFFLYALGESLFVLFINPSLAGHSSQLPPKLTVRGVFPQYLRAQKESLTFSRRSWTGG